MAEIGMTKLEAVNNLLRTIGHRAVSALDPGGISDAAEAERVLDRMVEQVQTDGHPSNTEYKVYTSSGAGVVTLDTDVLWIECVHPGRHAGRLKAVAGNQAYNVYEQTATLASGAIEVGIWQRVEIPWADCTPDLKHAIVARAETEFQALVRGRQDLLQYHAQREAEASASTDRGDTPPNTVARGGMPVARPQGGSDPR